MIREVATPAHRLATQYATTQNLDARIALHDRFTTSKTPWQHWVFDQLKLSRGAEVLEIGCGTGRLWAENATRVHRSWRLTLTDFSSAMVEQAALAAEEIPCRVVTCQAEATALPFDAGSFDVVIANHVLYHVGDRELALSEIARVLRPNGRLFAATNGVRHLQELHALIQSVAPEAPGENANALRFGAESGMGQLQSWFEKVDLLAHPDSLAVTDVGAVTDYIRSTERWRPLSDEAIAAIESLVAEAVAEHGAFVIRKHAVLFCADGPRVGPPVQTDKQANKQTDK